MGEYIKQDNYDAKIILENIKKLREFNGEESQFLAEFLKYIALLSKSPLSLYFSKNDKNEWILKSHYGFSNENQKELSESINFALSLCDRVLKNNFAYEKIKVKWLEFEYQTALAIKLDKKPKGSDEFLFLIIEQTNAQHLSEIIVRLILEADLPKQYYNKTSTKNSTISTDILEILSLIINQKKFILASMVLVNEIATRFNVTASIGWKKGDYIESVAISHIEKFDKHTDFVQSLEALYEESASQDEEILSPIDEKSSTIIFAHENYLKHSGLKQILSLPLRMEDEVVGVIVCEKKEEFFSDDEIISLRLILNHITNWLNELNKKDRWIGGKIALKTKESISSFLGIKNTFAKFVGITVSILFLYGLFATWQYKIEAVGALETDNIAFLSAPFNGFIYDVKVHAGDKVKKDDILLAFDKEDLLLKKAEAIADINKFKSESEKARAAALLADMQVALAKKRQAEVNLERIKYYLQKSNLIAPFDGIVIQGDKEELLGAPISKGDLLFKVANPIDLYLTFKIKESDIDDIEIDNRGKFSLLSSPDKKYNFKVEKIIPIAQIDKSEGNIFIVKAKITDKEENWWRPGMSGVAKIEIGERRVFWILTHKFIDFIRIYFWI